MTKHTSGPWHYNNGFIWSKQYRCICEVYPNIEITNDDISNARLIAAAPDLLEALEHLVYECEEGCNLTIFNVIDKEAKPAIAKSKGE